MSTANADLPRVSTILRILDDAYNGVPQAALDHAAKRGEALHRLCLSYLASTVAMCDPPIPTPSYLKAYESFQRWVKEHDVYPIAIEQESQNTKYGYRGRPDGLIQYGADRVLTIFDPKFTAAILRINRVQVQAYWRLDLYQEAKQAMLLHIHPVTGELTQHTIKKSPHDWAGFLNALSVWRWRQGS
jgi:hypothetical protein